MLHGREFTLCPQTDVSAYQNAAPGTNGRFDGQNRSILR
jgi:hypothetical protein